jgi:hypothetical protein
LAISSVSHFVGYGLSHTVAITNYVGGASTPRIYFGNIPETVTAKPVINYMIVGKPRLAISGVNRVHFQINVRDINPEQVWIIANLIISLFDNYQDVIDGYDIQCGYYDNSRMLQEPNGVYVVPIDIYITK